MEAPTNSSPKHLPIGIHFVATLWGMDNKQRATGKLYLLPPGHQNYDGIFELDNPELLKYMTNNEAVVSTGHGQKEKVQIDFSCSVVGDPHIHFSWA